jgi:hypothetical protein
MIQFSNKDIPKTLVFLNTSFSFSYLTLAKGGYIIRINPIARGRFVAPAENELMKVADEGMK